MNLSAIQQAMGPQSARFHVQWLARCGSTNQVLLEAARQGAPSGTLIGAEIQDAGRGRRGREWQHLKGNLAFSLLWHVPGDPSGLSLAVGLAVTEAFSPQVPDLRLKWPNDVLWQQKKAAGILIEVARPEWYVIGIGVNLGDAAALPAELNATALPCANREQLAARLFVALAEVLDRFAASGFAGFHVQWMARDAFANSQVLVSGATSLTGIVRGIDEAGALLLETNAGTIRVMSGDVSLRPA